MGDTFTIKITESNKPKGHYEIGDTVMFETTAVAKPGDVVLRKTLVDNEIAIMEPGDLVIAKAVACFVR